MQLHSKVLIVLCLLCFSSLCDYSSSNSLEQSDFHDFSTWTQKRNRNYLFDDERSYRRQIYATTVEKVSKHNADPSQTYRMGLNKFADMTSKEYSLIYLNAIPNAIEHVSNGFQSRRNLQGVNITVDWVAAGIVTPVRDMKQCGASWIFSATGAIESLIKNATNATVHLSEQQGLDCTVGYCGSGFPYRTFNLSLIYGMVTNDSYPYLASENIKTSICLKTEGPYKISNITAIAPGCLSIALALTTAPLPVYVENNNNWQYYSSGIFNGCSGGTQNYYILLVGVSSTAWTLKNSLGTDWGEAGFMRLAPGNTCRICDAGTYLPVY